MSIKGASHVTAFAASVALSAADGAADMVMNADGTASQRVRLIPMGIFTTRGKGRFVVADLAAAQSIVTLSRQYAGADDIAVDYDHQTVYGAVPGVGGTAPASGWIRPSSLSAEADGIYGTIDWTAEAAAKIKARQYRYLSPNIAHDPKTGQVFALMNAGLTNTPAIDGLTKLAANASQTHQEPIMDLTALAALYGLASTATIEEIMAAARTQGAALSAAQGQLTALRAAAGIAETADATAALSAITALKAGGNNASTVALMASMQSDLTRLTTAANEREVDDSIKAGRVIPAQRAHFVALMASDPSTARALMGSNPVVVADTSLDAKKPAGEKITALSAEQTRIANLLGVSEADFLKTLQENAQ